MSIIFCTLHFARLKDFPRKVPVAIPKRQTIHAAKSCVLAGRHPRSLFTDQHLVGARSRSKSTSRRRMSRYGTVPTRKPAPHGRTVRAREAAKPPHEQQGSSAVDTKTSLSRSSSLLFSLLSFPHPSPPPIETTMIYPLTWKLWRLFL